MNPEYKDKLATNIESNFLTLEDRIMKDIVRRIHKAGEITSTADWQINRLLILGNSSEDIERMIKDALDASYPDMFELYDKVINWEYVRNKDIYEQINAEYIPFEKNEYLKQLTESFIRQSGEEMKNITQSMGFYLDYNGQKVLTPLAEIYHGYLDDAIMDITTGSFDYNTVLRRTVKNLTDSGLRKIEYASGRAYRANVAARMAVMTGVSQLTGKITEYNAEKLGTDHFEVAWHAGARPTHQAWQGKVYTKEELTTICGLGTAEGLLGVNCYHEYYPFFPGISERNWTDKWLADQNKKENTPQTFKGKKYTLYEAKQRQRQMERIMRAQREKVVLMKEGHADREQIVLEQCKYQAQLDEYARFSKQMGLKQERARIYLDMKGRVAPNTADYKKYLLEKAKRDKIKADKPYKKKANIGGLSAYPKKYHKQITDFLDKAPDTCRKAWNNVCDEFHTITGKAYKEQVGRSARGAFYSPLVDSVYLNISKASKGSSYQTPFQVVFHEFGHHMDYIFNRKYGDGDVLKAFSETYKEGIFGKTIKKEAEKAIADFAKKNEMPLENMLDRYNVEEKFCDYMNEKYSLIARSDISDMFEPVMKSGYGYPFGVGHGSSYWRIRDNGKEGFAEMYSAMVNNPDSWKTIQEFFPESVKIFEDMLKVVK